MSDTGPRLKAALQEAGLNRRMGDAFRARDREREAVKAYEAGLGQLEPFRAGPDAVELVPMDRVELHGVRGGLLRRLGRMHEALASYEDGAVVERDTPLPSTYNRLNAIKLALILGKTKLAAANGVLLDLEQAINGIMRDNVQAASDAWTYADLGDVRLLAGHLPEALDAYQEFDERARTDSPDTTLTVLDDVVAGLRTHGDPGAGRLAADVNHIRELLRGARPTRSPES